MYLVKDSNPYTGRTSGGNLPLQDLQVYEQEKFWNM